MKLSLPFTMIIYSAMLIFHGLSAYPVPVDCINAPHQPLAEMIVIQDYGYKAHVGVDLMASTGTEVYSVMDGIVVRSEPDNNVYGRFVMVLHCDGYLSLYGHLSKLMVKFGEVVKSGQLIGLSGGDVNDPNRGISSGPHLHFEIRPPSHLDNNLYAVNPEEYLDLASRYGELPVMQ